MKVIHLSVWAGSLAMSAALIGCSTATSGPERPTQFEVDIDNAAQARLDGDAKRSARALHYYLIGQLLYSDKRFNDALANFADASDMLQGPAPMVNRRLAELYLRGGDVDKALIESSRALGVEPENLDLIRLYAGLLEARGRGEEAMPQFESLLRLDPGAIDAILLLAHGYLRAGDLAKASHVLEEGIKKHPREELLLYYLGQVSERATNLSRAGQAYASAIALDPAAHSYVLDRLRVALKVGKQDQIRQYARELVEGANPAQLSVSELESYSILKDLSQRILERRDNEGALRDLEALAQIESELAGLRMKLALRAVQAQQVRDATRELLLTLALRPDNSSARYVLASVYAGSGLNDDAVAELLKIGEDDELFTRSCTFASIILRQEKRFDEAEAVLRRGLSVEPTNSLLLSYLVTVLRDARKYTAAEEVLRESLERQPENDRLLFVLAQVLHEQDREDDAREAMEHAVKINPDNPEALNYIAYSIVEQADKDAVTAEQLDHAHELISRALVLKPNDGFLLDTLGWVYYHRGDYRSAADTLERALAVVGNDPVIMEHCADAAIKIGDQSRARSLYEAILDLQSRKGNGENDSDIIALKERVRRKLEALRSSLPVPGKDPT